MRSDREMLDLLLATARAEPLVRAVILSGSRADPAVPPDRLQDFDVVFVVDEVAPFRADTGRWRVFGEAAIVQLPDAMQGAPPRDDGGFAVLMQFVDGHRIDLTLLPTNHMPHFEHDGPAVVLHDPDGLVPQPPGPGEAHHLPDAPTRQAFADVCNELWWVAPYVAKGLVRGELTYARHHLDTVLRAQLMTMLDWYVLASSGGERGAGKCGRLLRRELPDALWTLLEETYADASTASAWQALEALTSLFRRVATAVAEHYGCDYPTGDDERVTALLRRWREGGPLGGQRPRWPLPAARNASQATILGELPDLFAFPDGRRIATPAEWPERADAWRDLVVDLGYGGLPLRPEHLELELRSETQLRQLSGAPRWQALRLRLALAGTELSFAVRLLLPDAPVPMPAIVYGDGCWWNLSDRTLAAFAAHGVALALFDRTEVAPDATGPSERRGGLFDLLPGHAFGALSAWAWGYGRVIDALLQLPQVDSDRLGVTGFSRGGKAALLAGATDARITLVHAHASGAGGAAPYRYLGEGAETLDVTRAFPTWFGPRLGAFRGRVPELPFDQHALLACVAPRALLLTVGVDDRWANPEGTLQAAWAAGEAYRLVGAPDALAVALREGGHAHTPNDWERLLEFAAWRWLGGPEPRGLEWQPFVGLRPAFEWRAPGVQPD